MSTKVQPSSKLQKPLVSAADIFPAVIAGTIMIWVIITELSILTYALSSDKNVLGFVSEYYKWRDTAPIIARTVFVIACLFPVALIQCSVAFFQTFTRSAPMSRHIIDCAQFFALCALVYATVTAIAPSTAAVTAAVSAAAAAAPTTSTTSAYVAMSSHLVQVKVQLFLQILLTVLPLARYAVAGVGSKAEVEAAAAADPVAAAKAAAKAVEAKKKAE